MKIVVTGPDGFIAKNLLAHFQFKPEYSVETISRLDKPQDIESKLAAADVVFHLAGVNKPLDAGEFHRSNAEFTSFIVRALESQKRFYKLIFSSSTQAPLDNDYGRSKRRAEEMIREAVSSGSALIYRLPGIFGKWCRPNYNSVVATFCHNIARNQEISIRDSSYELTLAYVDDVILDWMQKLNETQVPGSCEMKETPVKYVVTLGMLADKIKGFRKTRTDLTLPDVADPFEKALYSTYLSYLPTTDFSYQLDLKTDNRGSLFELFKSRSTGQIFLSTTLPSITRGNHFHHTKVEKFVVIAGKGCIQFREIAGEKVIEYNVDGEHPTVVDIPPGYTHNITNTGDTVMVTLFWANEIFDAQRPDTYFLKV